MEFLEKDLEQIISESSNFNLRQRDLPIFGRKMRQVRIGNYGIADLITVDRATDFDFDENKIIGSRLIINVYELKKDKIGISAFLQAIRYAKGISRYLEKRGIDFDINIKLIGQEVDLSGDFVYISDILRYNVEMYLYSYKLDGLTFKRVLGYNLKNEGF